jgi:hypothetical protein
VDAFTAMAAVVPALRPLTRVGRSTRIAPWFNRLHALSAHHREPTDTTEQRQAASGSS